GKMPVPRPDAVRVPEIDHVAVAPVLAAHARHDAVGSRAHGGAVGRREVDALVGPPAVQDGMKAGTEAARDPAELERRAEERPAQRPAALVVESVHAPAYALVRIFEVKGVLGRAGYVHPGRQDSPEAPLALGGVQPLEQHREAVARADVAR